jgi:hypothetical protein
MRSEFADVRAEIRNGFADVRAEIRDGNEANRRYTDVLVETLRDDIRILAEGFAAISIKLDSLQR